MKKNYESLDKDTVVLDEHGFVPMAARPPKMLETFIFGIGLFVSLVIKRLAEEDPNPPSSSNRSLMDINHPASVNPHSFNNPLSRHR